MLDTPNLALPLIAAAQAQKHVTHNEALLALDSLAQIAAIDEATAPPPTPAEGERRLVGAGATGAFAGRDGQLATRQDGVWTFRTPRAGWLCWLVAGERLLVHDGTTWRDAPARSAQTFGVQATADAVNRLAVASPAALFTHAGGDMRLIVNKAAATATGALVFQSAWSGRAEIGLAGDDDLRLKVSADGASWRSALVVSRATGAVSFPNGGVRRQILADLALYVNGAIGADSNDGLSAASAFATLQKAWDELCKLDLSIFTATINVAAGTYSAGIVSGAAPVGGASIVIQGDVATPANVSINTANHGFYFGGALPCPMTIRGFRIAATGASKGGVVLGGRGVATCAAMEAAGGSTGFCGFYATQSEGARIVVTTGQSITGGMSAYVSSTGGVVQFHGITVTLTGAPAFSWGFAQCASMGLILASGVTFSGAATGVRYGVTQNSVINTGAGGASYFPGSSAGSAASGGQYV
jgi:hypothetical protein